MDEEDNSGNTERGEAIRQQALQEFVEVDSASELNRPIFAEMLLELKKQKAGSIVFHSVDRSARNPYDQAKIYKLIQEGYTFHFVAENLSTDNPTARSMILIMWGMASSFTENLKFHVNKGIIGMLNDGRSPSRAPIGYLDKGKGVKEIDPVQGPLVKRAFELFSTGTYDVISLAKKLRGLGLLNKNGRSVNDQTLYKIFRNKFYYGIMTYRKIEYNGGHDKLITKALFDKVQDVLNKRSFKHQRLHLYIFQSLLVCPTCDKPLRSISAKKHYKYYNCRYETCTFKKTIRESEVEAAFLDALRKLEFNETEVGMFLKAIAQFRKDLKQSSAEQLKHFEMEETKIDQYLEDLLTKNLEGKITDEEYRQMKAKYLSKRQDTQERKTALSRADEDICDQIAKIGKLLQKPVNAYFLAHDEGKRNLVKSLVENITIGSENPSIHWKKEFQIVSNRLNTYFGSATGN